MGTKGVVACCVVVVIVLGAVGVARMVGNSAVTIDRADVVGQEGDEASNSATTNAGPSAGDEGKEPSGGSSAAGNTSQPMKETVVHVDGAVAHPGVYVLRGESVRVNDAIESAGGLLPEAETAGLNLAARLEDGQKVHVPVVGEELEPTVIDVSQNSAVAVGGQSNAGSGLININTATEAELQQLPGIGEALAAAIVDDRASNGPFASIEDLMRVSGIGEKKFAKLRDGICV